MIIDKNIRKLIDILNSFPGITTCSSCGGHKIPNVISQCPENEFYVVFEIFGNNKNLNLPCKEGWSSLGRISHALLEYNCMLDDDEIRLSVINLSDLEDDPKGLCIYFELKGKDANIKKLCKDLEFVLNYKGGSIT